MRISVKLLLEWCSFHCCSLHICSLHSSSFLRLLKGCLLSWSSRNNSTISQFSYRTGKHALITWTCKSFILLYLSFSHSFSPRFARINIPPFVFETMTVVDISWCNQPKYFRSTFSIMQSLQFSNALSNYGICALSIVPNLQYQITICCCAMRETSLI